MSTADRRRRERAEREQRITAAARAIAEGEGWSAVTIRRLAGEIEYSQPVLYSHFENRDAIVTAVAITGFRELTSALGQVASGPVDLRVALGTRCHRVSRLRSRASRIVRSDVHDADRSELCQRRYQTGVARRLRGVGGCRCALRGRCRGRDRDILGDAPRTGRAGALGKDQAQCARRALGDRRIRVSEILRRRAASTSLVCRTAGGHDPRSAGVARHHLMGGVEPASGATAPRSCSRFGGVRERHAVRQSPPNG